MRKYITALVAALFALGLAQGAAADTTRTQVAGLHTWEALPSAISIDSPPAIKAGQMILIDATLVAAGSPVANADLHFIIDGIEIRIERTDSLGVGHFAMRGVLPAGVHRVTVRYYGDHNSSHSLRPSAASASATFTVGKLILAVQTVPQVPGLDLVLDRKVHFTTDSAGLAEVAVATAGMHSLSVNVPAPGPQTRVTFARWSDDSWTPSRQIRIQTDVQVDLGLRMSYLTKLTFDDRDGNPLDPTHITNVVLSGPNAEQIGVRYPFPPVWLSTPLPSKHSGEQGLHITPTPYSILSAEFDGLDVASQGQQRYTPTPGGLWTINLQLFTLTIHAQDAIFRTGISAPLTLVNPLGSIVDSRLDSDGKVTFLLGRGNYTAHVSTAGISPSAPIALSRSQTAVVPVITPLDLTLIAVCVFVTLLGLAIAGRHRQRFMLALQGAGAAPQIKLPSLPYAAGRLARGLVPRLRQATMSVGSDFRSAASRVASLPKRISPPAARHAEATALEPGQEAVVDDVRGRYEAFKRQALSEVRLLALYLEALEPRAGRRGSADTIVVAWGFTDAGTPALLHVGHATGAADESWMELVDSLSSRGLKAPMIAVSGDGLAPTIAIQTAWPDADRQRSAVHRLHAVTALLPRRPELRARVSSAFWRALDSAESSWDGEWALHNLVSELGREHPAAAAVLGDDLPALCAHLAYPARMRRRLRSSSLLERHASALKVHAQAIVPGQGGASLLWTGVHQIVSETRGVAAAGFELRQMRADRRGRSRVEMTA